MATSKSMHLRVFSLNCWGIRYVSKHCVERFKMIGDLLSREDYDIVLLQEVWSEKDVLYLKKTLSYTHPYSHHFKSGVIGSGLAVFSKYRIHDAFLYRFSVNGYPYKVQHGDWFGGKAVGMVQMKIGGLMAHIYVTHLHAEYCREKDAYLPHRVVQAWELQHFIRHTSRGADLVILGGDFNMHPQDLGCRLLRTSTGLRDCYTETDKFDGCENGHTLIANNPFINEKELRPFEKGIRIDYILFKGSKRVEMKCESLSTTQGSYPGRAFPLSDHEALSAHLLLVPSDPASQQGEPESGKENTGKLAELVDLVTEARTEVKVGVHCAQQKRYSAARTGGMGLALLLLELAIAAVPWLATAAAQHPFPRASFYLLGALCFCLLLCAVVLWLFHSTELKALQSADDHMRLAAASLQEELRGAKTPPPQHAHGENPTNQDACSKED
ncbi:sphingomyelin phosphodiesterase 2 [Clupea harengus]|uniref:sphingomyelin phosphodiesterase n=1 Tax=Clupea harengus TaxID=7950 RepID=A0A6P8FKD3_CLUHA|nr:sphingomyelin phosphodiesterase 2 [Clupea harengus]XP_031423632.1 sphingomyelin phosphodiesterase 2 [Clupea harengus]